MMGGMYDSVLVPTDGSDHAIRAAEHAGAIARLFGASVHVISVVDVGAAAGPFDAGGIDQGFLDRLEAAAEDRVDEAVDAVGAGLSVEREILQGTPSDEIVDYADEQGIDLIGMGTHGRSGIQRYVAGSVTERVLRLAPVPVVTTRAVEGSRRTDYDDILIPTDGSEPAEAAIDHGIAIAERADARVHAIYVVNVRELATGPDVAPPTTVLESHREQGAEATEAIAERARAAGLEAVTAVREDYPARGILEYVEETDLDLIAMGTAGRTGLNRFILGSTTERIVRNADVPVMGVNARELLDEQ